MKVLVCDSSILIEFSKRELLDKMFHLEFQFAVPDLLFHEEPRTWPQATPPNRGTTTPDAVLSWRSPQWQLRRPLGRNGRLLQSGCRDSGQRVQLSAWTVLLGSNHGVFPRAVQEPLLFKSSQGPVERPVSGEQAGALLVLNLLG